LKENIMSNQTLRHTASEQIKSAFKSESDNVALATLTSAALAALRGGRGLSVVSRQKRVADAQALLTSAQALATSPDAKGSLSEAVDTLGEVTFPESSYAYAAPTYTWDSEYDSEFDEDDDEE